jgi:hypothetical protein
MFFFCGECRVMLEVNRDVVGVHRVCCTEELWVSGGMEMNGME